ncbi:IclR family transcriptional regulator [Kineosporia babensis]|uniref:Glycerol operon regulatory protein n=1 Tax=Kineosporia babensis TaxID=499548 RepID=A0A9X1NCF2_9ACTN|nr:IclR family transcriptional regulator [Kineosporia babensis]MCD5311206.1 IclR family transcriptional regulator [Kineosporia babensis]
MGVQSIERAFGLLEAVAGQGQMSLSQLAAACQLPLPTIHRLARTMVDLGYLRQEPNRQYTLGPRVLLFGESSSKMLNNVALPHLRALVEEIGETANLAMRDGDQVAYIAQAPGRHAMRMFTEVGRRVLPHCTAVGKVLLAPMNDDAVRLILRRTGMPRHTEHTLVQPEEYVAHLARVRELGYAVDEGEQEVGVRCVAVAVPHPLAHLAISLSGPAPRMSDELLTRALPLLRRSAQTLAGELR